MRSSRSMVGLARFLAAKNYEVINLSYPSTKYNLEELVQIIQAKVPQDNIKTHFVAYSMGGLITRAYIAKSRPTNLGRVVMLGTPNKGSEVANLLKSFSLYKLFYGPAGQQLVTGYDQQIFGAVDYELGIIAGNKTIDPICYFLLPRPNDGKVSVESTKLEGMKEHVTIPVTHTFFPQNKKAWELVYKFIKNGCFTTPDDTGRDVIG